MNITPRNSKDKRYHSIDFCKGVCILFVIVLHYNWTVEEELKLLFPFWLYMIVPIFMIVSGYVYTKSYQKNNINKIDEAYTVNVLSGKIIRYTIPFLFTFIIEEIICRITGVRHSFFQMCMFFLQGGTGPGSYYYPIMIQFLFFFPIVFFIIRRYSYKGLFLCGGINLVYEVLKSAYGMNEGCYRLLLFRYTMLIAYGCYLASDNYSKHMKISIFSFCLGITYIILFVYGGFVPPVTFYFTGSSMWAVLYLIPFSRFLLLNNIHNRILETAGKASYHIFLVQKVFYSSFASKVYHIIPNRILQLLFNIVFCVLAGICFYYLETPITKKINSIVNERWNGKSKEIVDSIN